MKPIHLYCFRDNDTNMYVISEVALGFNFKTIFRMSCIVIADMSSTDEYEYEQPPQVGDILNDYDGRKIKVISIQQSVLRPFNYV